MKQVKSPFRHNNHLHIAGFDFSTVKYKTDGNAGGNRVYGKDDYGYLHCFMHLADNTISVKVGDIINQYEKIAIMGNTGIGTGIHLHYEIRTGWAKSDSVFNPLDINEGLMFLKTNR